MSDFNGGSPWLPCTTCGWPVLDGEEWCIACGVSVDAEPEPDQGQPRVAPACSPRPLARGSLPSSAYGGEAPFIAWSGTSADAAASVDSLTGAMRWRVFQFIAERGDATCDEVEVALEMPHQTASARIRELVLDGRLTRTAEKRKTRSGRNADVIIVTAPAAATP